MNSANDFVHNFDSDNLPLIVTKFFDEIMVLYNLIGNRQDLEVCTDDSSSLAIFTILVESENDAKNIYEKLNGSYFSVYGDMFAINMEMNRASIKTIISKTTS